MDQRPLLPGIQILPEDRCRVLDAGEAEGRLLRQLTQLPRPEARLCDALQFAIFSFCRMLLMLATSTGAARFARMSCCTLTIVQ